MVVMPVQHNSGGRRTKCAVGSIRPRPATIKTRTQNVRAGALGVLARTFSALSECHANRTNTERDREQRRKQNGFHCNLLIFETDAGNLGAKAPNHSFAGSQFSAPRVIAASRCRCRNPAENCAILRQIRGLTVD
jgi:hypothetical protein